MEQPKKGKLIVIVGATGSGKTALANEVILRGVNTFDKKWSLTPQDDGYFEELKEVTSDPDNTYFYARKYVTRDLRKEDTGIIHCTKEEMDSTCDVVVKGYKEEDYIGFNINEIISQIDQGKFPVIVTGFMEVLQLILKKFDELGRLDDICMVGIDGPTYSREEFIELERKRHNYEMDDSILDSADKRFKQSRLFLRQYYYFRDFTKHSEKSVGMLYDTVVPNLRFKYAETDTREAGEYIFSFVDNSTLGGHRNEKQIKKIKEFIGCDLSIFKPVEDKEVKHI